MSPMCANKLLHISYLHIVILCFLLQLTCGYHSFNMQHDGLGNDCNPSGNIMASRLVTGPGLFKWSSCSASYLEQYRGRGLTQCLRDAPGGSSTSVNANALPGRGTSATEQCRKSRGPSSTPCSFSQTPDVSTYT